MSVTKIHISRVAQVQSRAGGYAIEFFGVCFIVAIYLRWFKEEKCLNVRQKLGTRNVIENYKKLKNCQSVIHSLIIHIITLPCEFRVHRAGYQLKNV